MADDPPRRLADPEHGRHRIQPSHGRERRRHGPHAHVPSRLHRRPGAQARRARRGRRGRQRAGRVPERGGRGCLRHRDPDGAAGAQRCTPARAPARVPDRCPPGRRDRGRRAGLRRWRQRRRAPRGPGRARRRRGLRRGVRAGAAAMGDVVHRPRPPEPEEHPVPRTGHIACARAVPGARTRRPPSRSRASPGVRRSRSSPSTT